MADNVKKEINYLGKDFGQFRKNLIDFTRQYFPNEYNDFNESSPGMMFMEQASVVGDVLSYYNDVNLKEALLEQASERGNIYDHARTLGYKPKNAIPAYVTLDVYQLVPATGSGDNVAPDFNYGLNINPGMRVKQKDGNAEFRTLDGIDFKSSSSFDPTEVTIFESDDTTKQPVYYSLKKSVEAVSGEVRTFKATFGSPIQYDKVLLSETNIIEIVSVEETDGDNWYEVPYLAQDTIFEEVPNTMENDPDLYSFKDSAPMLLKLRKTSKRFITRLRSDNKTEIQFGAGISDNNDEEILPNPTNVGNGLSHSRRAVDINIDPSNFLNTRAYGQAPSNTTLTFTYTVGNGVSENVPSGVITELDFISFNEDVNAVISGAMVNFVKESIAITNPGRASGAKTADTLQDIKNNAAANFATQGRAVIREDYIIRSYSMPSRFGSVAKSYIVPDDQIQQSELVGKRIANPLAMNMYLLGYNENKQLTELNQAIKENLKTYLSHYRMLTDAVNIKDAFIINIGLDFEITVKSNFNSNDVLVRVINELKSYFDIDKWALNQPILVSDVKKQIANVKGVQSVVDVEFKNLYESGAGYSGNLYDLYSAEKSGVIYPSLDPSIFEVKYPNTDIKGRVVNY